ATALPGRRAEERDRPADVVDADVLVELVGFLVDRALQHEEVALGLDRDAPGNRVIGVDVERFRRLNRRHARIGMGEDEARHAIGERRLADAGRPADQPGVRETRAPIGREQRALRLRMAVEDGGLAWERRVGAPGLLVGVVPNAAPPGTPRTRAPTGRSVMVFQMRSATMGFGSVASIATQRPGSAVAIWR